MAFTYQCTAIDCIFLKEIVLHLIASICCLNTLPTSFLLSVFGCLAFEIL